MESTEPTTEAVSASSEGLAILYQTLGHEIHQGIELRLTHQKLREISSRLVAQHAPGLCTPVVHEPPAVPLDAPAEPTPLHPDCHACAAERSG